MSLPSQGFVLCLGVFGLDTEYFVLGPMAEGSWLRRVRVAWVAEATTVLRVGVALGAVNEASEVSYRGASGLISPGSYVILNKPVIALLCGGSLGGWFDIPVGVRIDSGSKWLVGVVSSGTAEADVSVVVSAECLQATEAEKG